VHKVYLAPATPCERLLAHSSVEAAIKEKLNARFMRLDPVQLLLEIRSAQQTLCDLAAHGEHNEATTEGASEVSVFLASLSMAWKDGEARPTHRKQPKAKHWWRNRPDPFADAWPVIEGWLIAEPPVQASVLMDRLAAMVPDAYVSKVQLRTLQRRVKSWRSERVKEMVLGSLGKSKAAPVEVDRRKTSRPRGPGAARPAGHGHVDGTVLRVVRIGDSPHALLPERRLWGRGSQRETRSHRLDPLSRAAHRSFQDLRADARATCPSVWLGVCSFVSQRRS
jgi:hypothetical protein